MTQAGFAPNEILIRIEGVVDIRQEKYANGKPTNIDAWRTVFASLQGEELFFKDIQTNKESKRRSHLNSPSVFTRTISNARKTSRPISLIGEPQFHSVKPARPVITSHRQQLSPRKTTRLRRSLSEGMLPTSDEKGFLEKWNISRSRSFEKLAAEDENEPTTPSSIDHVPYLVETAKQRSFTLNSRLSQSTMVVQKNTSEAAEPALATSLSFRETRISWLMELVDQPDIQFLLQEEEEHFLSRTVLYCTSSNWGVYLIRADTPALATNWCRELRRAARRRSSAVVPAEVARILAEPTEPLPTVDEGIAVTSPEQFDQLPPLSPLNDVEEAPRRTSRISKDLTIDVTLQNPDLSQPSPYLSDTARRSHCIPHHFISENLLLRLVKCKLCNKTIRDFRGARCVHCNGFYHKACSLEEVPNCGMAHIQKALEEARLKAKPAKPSAGSPQQAFYPSQTMQRKMKTIGDDLFGVPLEELDAADNGLPYIIVLCVNAIDRRGLSSEGIYRVSGVKKDLERLRVYFAFGRPDLINEKTWPDINVIAGVFKAWLRELPDPLMTFDLFVEFTDLVDDQRTPRVILSELKAVLAKLPPLQYRILHYLMDHLRRTADNSKENKMLSSNLAVVFGPTLLRPREEGSMKKLPERVSLIEFLIEHHHEVFGKPEKGH